MTEERMNEKSPIAQENFYDSLNKKYISKTNYELYLQICERFNLTTNKDYHDLYLKLDICLLADVFENFRKISLKTYKLDPLYYISAPGLSWDALLKYSEVSLELISDKEMYHFIEKSKRGGLSMITTRFAQANNKYMPNFDKTKESTYLMYYDMNNLYGGAMCRNLPTNDFKWIDRNELNKTQEYINKVLNSNIDDNKGYILGINGYWPDHLHDKLNDFPPMPDTMIIKNEELSEYRINLKEKFNDTIVENKVDKLVANLKPKTDYILHYSLLKYCIELGFIVTGFTRGIKFTQKPFMKSYIDLNTFHRSNAKNDFEKAFYKLMNNSCFGKTIENVRNRKRIEIIVDEKQLQKAINKPIFKSRSQVNETTQIIQYKKTSVKLNKPIFVGCAILDLSKLDMLKFHYNTMHNKYGDKQTLLFTDTDSLAYKIQTNDVYNDIKTMKDQFDLSNYSKSHRLFDDTNNKQLFKMKDELEGNIMTEFIGLRSKMYSYLFLKNKEDKIHNEMRAKGIKSVNMSDKGQRHEADGSIVQNQIKHAHYHDALFNQSREKVEYKSIQSKNHNIETKNLTKLGLSCYDDKRFILSNGIDTRSFGYYKNNLKE
eukprot:Lithocolla_globosa_v1_NODE_674_length_3463_cov_2.828052.p1 type:complete len:601 gc:universal NODE_674_length_3463_cov_2.828052:2865-1063(-)